MTAGSRAAAMTLSGVMRAIVARMGRGLGVEDGNDKAQQRRPRAEPWHPAKPKSRPPSAEAHYSAILSPIFDQGYHGTSRLFELSGQPIGNLVQPRCRQQRFAQTCYRMALVVPIL